MNAVRIRLFARLPVVAVLASLATGCGEDAPTAPDADEARALLMRTLDSWREGRPITDQSAASPPVVVSDMKWERGDRLAKYEVAPEPKPSGAQQKFRVTLWFADAGGKEKKDVAHYEVGLHPVPTVFRAMFQ